MGDEITIERFNAFQSQIVVMDANGNGVVDASDVAVASEPMAGFQRGDRVPFEAPVYQKLLRKTLEAYTDEITKKQRIEARNKTVEDLYKVSLGKPVGGMRCGENLGIYAKDAEGNPLHIRTVTSSCLGGFTLRALSSEVSRVLGVDNKLLPVMVMGEGVGEMLAQHGYHLDLQKAELTYPGRTKVIPFMGNESVGGFNNKVTLTKLSNSTLQIDAEEEDGDHPRYLLDLVTGTLSELVEKPATKGGE